MNKNKTKSHITEESIAQSFQKCRDVKMLKVMFGEKGSIELLFVYTDEMCDMVQFNQVIIPDLQKLLDRFDAKTLTGQTLLDEWHKPSLEIVPDINEIIDKVFEGYLIIWIGKVNTAYSIAIPSLPQRNPEEPNTEITVRGPRDGFIEELSVNAAIIRKRLRTNSLKYEQFIIGKRSKTKVGLMYVDDIIRPEVLGSIQDRLSKIETDAIFNATQLEDLLIDTSYPIFPLFHYSGRADFCVDSMLRGRFVILVDGNPSAILGPVNLMMLLKTGEDSEAYYLYNSFERLLRIFGMTVALFFPGFFVALNIYHPDQIPLVLLSTLIEVRHGVPLPLPLEAITMAVLFELFREAGMRLPLAIGQILTVVGGLIIGDAAIRAGITSPAMVVTISIGAVSTFTLPNQGLQGVVSILRIFILVMASFLGFFGYLVASFLIFLYVANIRSFGLPYLAPLSPIQIQDFAKAVIRPSFRKQKARPNLFKSEDSDRQGG